MENEQERQEAKVDVFVVANDALRVSERLKQMAEAGGLWQRSCKVLAIPLETTKRDVDWNIDINTPANHEVEHMAGHEPRDDEETKHQVTSSSKAEILEAFGELEIGFSNVKQDHIIEL